MKPYKSKYPIMMQQYFIMMDMARDKDSNLYTPGGGQRKGASHRDSFWRGFNFGDTHPNLIPARNTLAYPCFRAGMDFKAEIEAKCMGAATSLIHRNPPTREKKNL